MKMKKEIEVTYVVEEVRKCKVKADTSVTATEIASYLMTKNEDYEIEVLEDEEIDSEIISLDID